MNIAPSVFSIHPSRHTTLKWCRINVDVTWSRRIDVDTTSFWCCVPAGMYPSERRYSALYSKLKILSVIDNILSENICRFCSYALFSNIYPKINFMAKIGSGLCSFNCKLDFLEMFYQNSFFFLFFFFFSLLILNYPLLSITIMWNSLRKHAYLNILKILPPKKWKFSDKTFWYSSYFCSKHRLCVRFRTASKTRGGSNVSP